MVHDQEDLHTQSRKRSHQYIQWMSDSPPRSRSSPEPELIRDSSDDEIFQPRDFSYRRDRDSRNGYGSSLKSKNKVIRGMIAPEH